VEEGEEPERALEIVRRSTVFTTHTPVPAGNETYAPDEFLATFDDLRVRLGIDEETFLGLCRVDPHDASERPGMTPLALRSSARRNGVSALHGEVARAMWRPLFPDENDVPIGHVTNGAHLPTFLGGPMRELLDRHLGEDWLRRAADPATWQPVQAIPDAELWAARCASRSSLVAYARDKGAQDELLRGEQIEYVRSMAQALEPDALTLGFARRIATYKRLYLLTLDQERARRILGDGPRVQILVAGKAHPADAEGKDTLQSLYRLRQEDDRIGHRIVFVEDYDLDVARELVAGCDVWVNLPRRPMEASGTSGMKSTFNGGLQLSVLDGWWAEAYDGQNGWGIAGDESEDHAAADAHDAECFYDLLEREVIPLFYDRDENGVPHGWCERIKAALVSCAPRFTATRMVDDYAARMYPATSPGSSQRQP